MTREMFDQELTDLGALLNEEARLCQRSLDGALEALIAPDSNAADTVIAGDDAVDRVYLQVEHGVESLLARQSPVAVDLRFVLAVIHVNQNLERIGDQCVNIAKLSRLFVQQPLTPELLEDFTVMGNQASGMIATAMDSFVQRDLEQAESLVELDQVINERNHGLARRIIEGGGSTSRRSRCRCGRCCRPRHRAHRRQRGRYRRADRLPGDGGLPRVHGRLTPGRVASGSQRLPPPQRLGDALLLELEVREQVARERFERRGDRDAERRACPRRPDPRRPIQRPPAAPPRAGDPPGAGRRPARATGSPGGAPERGPGPRAGGDGARTGSSAGSSRAGATAGRSSRAPVTWRTTPSAAAPSATSTASRSTVARSWRRRP